MPPVMPPQEPDVTPDEVGRYFDAAIATDLSRSGVPDDVVAQLRARHIDAVLNNPAAVDGIVAMRRPVPPMEVLLARYTGGNVPRHGDGSLPHGYVGTVCNDDCNNIQCPLYIIHSRCTVECLVTAGRTLLYVPAWRRILLDDELRGSTQCP